MAEKTTSTRNMCYDQVCSSDWGDKGIGYETCKQLASKGVVVVLTSRDEKRDIQAIERLKEESNFTDEQILFHQLDVMDPTSISSLVNFIKTKFGRLDILEGLTEELPIKKGLLIACLYPWHGTDTLPAGVTDIRTVRYSRSTQYGTQLVPSESGLSDTIIQFSLELR
ncbi:(+)-neomenthol dehydrogenase [Capsicum chinense]|nr:(+)-neomenthol dehydrogenase [Capsicum chinense]